MGCLLALEGHEASISTSALFFSLSVLYWFLLIGSGSCEEIINRRKAVACKSGIMFLFLLSSCLIFYLKCSLD